MGIFSNFNISVVALNSRYIELVMQKNLDTAGKVIPTGAGYAHMLTHTNR